VFSMALALRPLLFSMNQAPAARGRLVLVLALLAGSMDAAICLYMRGTCFVTWRRGRREARGCQ
jgi:hypothetical protein